MPAVNIFRVIKSVRETEFIIFIITVRKIGKHIAFA